MKFEITKEVRDKIVNYLASTNLPAKDAIAIINTLNTLPAVTEAKETPKE